VYLGVTLDWSLSYREHLSCSAVKLNSRNNLIVKLAVTSWRPSASTLRTSALALCYSVTEYCCTVWARSNYTNLTDTQLHSAMFLISGCLKPMQLSWLPVLSSVAPPSVCRKVATDNMLQIIEAHPNWPVCADVFEHSSPRLASQRAIWSDITSVSVNTIMLWWEDWSSASVVNHIIVTDPTIWQPGFDLPCHTWSLMNRFRTGQLAHVMLTCTNGASPSHLPMIVASNRPWTTLSTRAR